MRAVIPSLLVGALLSLIGCLGDEAKLGCRTDGDCRGARICEEGVCEDVPGFESGRRDAGNNGTGDTVCREAENFVIDCFAEDSDFSTVGWPNCEGADLCNAICIVDYNNCGAIGCEFQTGGDGCTPGMPTALSVCVEECLANGG